MKGPVPNRLGRVAHRSRAVGAAGAAALLIAGVWAGCTVTEDNYALLSMMFDGVPDPRVRQAAAGSPSGNEPRNSPTYTLHRPYAEDRCDACHSASLRLTRDHSDRCMECHEEVPRAHARMHGPVAAGACLWCHAPHESAYAFLLRDQPVAVCAQCHTPELLDAERVPEHADASRSCLECHFGHGGDKPYFLTGAARLSGGPEER